MIDKYDVFYGIADQTKEKVVYWILTTIFSLSVLYWFREKDSFFHFNLPNNINEIYLFLLSVFVLGLFIYTIILVISLFSDIKNFKRRYKKFFIQSRVLNRYQKERILKKIYIRKEIYTIVLKPNENRRFKLSEKQWKFYIKKVGTRNELLSKMKFLYYIEMKIREETPLKNQEIDYLNDLMFSKEDVNLYQKLQSEILH